MADASIITKQNAFRKIEEDSVAAAYVAAEAAITSTRPSKNLVWDWQAATGNGSPSLLHLLPFTDVPTGSSIGMRLVGWRSYPDINGTTTWWLPTILQTFVLLAKSAPTPTETIDGNSVSFFNGITGSAVAAAPTPNFFSPRAVSATSADICSVLLDPIGCQLVTVQFQSSGTPTMGVFAANV